MQFKTLDLPGFDLLCYHAFDKEGFNQGYKDINITEQGRHIFQREFKYTLVYHITKPRTTLKLKQNVYNIFLKIFISITYVGNFSNILDDMTSVKCCYNFSYTIMLTVLFT